MSSFFMKTLVGNEFNKVIKGRIKEIFWNEWSQSFFSRLLEFSGSDKDEDNEDDGISREELAVSKALLITPRLI